MRLFALLIALLLFTVPALAQPAAVDLTVNGDPVTIQTGTEAALAIVRVAASAGQHVQLLVTVPDDSAYVFVYATLPDGTYLGDIATYDLPTAEGDGIIYEGPLYIEQDGVIEFAIRANSDPFDITVSAIALEPVLVEIGDTVTFPLSSGTGTYVAFAAQVDDRVAVVVESDLDTEMMAISPQWTTTTPDGDGGMGRNPELNSYWVRSDGYEYLYISNVGVESGDVTVRVYDNPIMDVTQDGTVITIVPNAPTPMQIFRLRYTAGTDNIIRVETVDGAPTGNIFIQIFRDGVAGEVISGNNAAEVTYAFHATEDGQIIFSIQDNLDPTNEYRVSGGEYFAG